MYCLIVNSKSRSAIITFPLTASMDLSVITISLSNTPTRLSCFYHASDTSKDYEKTQNFSEINYVEVLQGVKAS